MDPGGIQSGKHPLVGLLRHIAHLCAIPGFSAVPVPTSASADLDTSGRLLRSCAPPQLTSWTISCMRSDMTLSANSIPLDRFASVLGCIDAIGVARSDVHGAGLVLGIRLAHPLQGLPVIGAHTLAEFVYLRDGLFGLPVTLFRSFEIPVCGQFQVLVFSRSIQARQECSASRPWRRSVRFSNANGGGFTYAIACAERGETRPRAADARSSTITRQTWRFARVRQHFPIASPFRARISATSLSMLNPLPTRCPLRAVYGPVLVTAHSRKRLKRCRPSRCAVRSVAPISAWQSRRS